MNHAPQPPLRFIFSLLACTPFLSAAAQNPALLKSEFVFDRNPVPSCHATTLVETRKNTLVTAWFGGTAEGNRDVCIWLSRNSSGEWSAPCMVAQADPYPCWNPVLFQHQDGRLLLFYKAGPSPSTWWGMLKTSADDGQTWSAAARLPEGFIGPVKNKPVQLADGSILCPSSTETSSQPSVWRVHFELTKRAEDDWTRLAPASPGNPALDAIQPSFLFLGAQKLMALGRTRQGFLFTVSSADLGKTWDGLQSSTLPNPNSGTDAVTLQDGRHLLIYNHTKKGRSPLNVALSDDAKVWEGALVLEDEPKMEFSYPAIIQTADGLVHATYTWKRKLVKHVVIDPKKLRAKPIVDGNWPAP